MISLLAIMLYLQLIVPNGQYQQSYIDQLQQANQTQIQNVENNQPLNDQVQAQYDPPAGTVVIFPENME